MNTTTIARAPTIRRRLRAAKRFSWPGFLVTVAASLLGALVPAAIGAGPNATLITTVVTTLLAAGGLTARDGTAHGVKAIAIVLLAAGAMVLTVTGVTVLDLARGIAVTGGRIATFPVVADAADTPSDDPLIGVPGSVACGAGTCEIGVRSIGSTPLRITGTELNGDDFAVDDSDCVGRDVVPGQRCTLIVTFTPTGPGVRVADLTIRHNVPGPAAFVELTGEASAALPQ